MLKSRYILYVLLAGFALCLTSQLTARKPSGYDRAAAMRKAEAIYGHATVHEALDSDIYAYRLLDYALSINPDDSALRYDRDRELLFAEGRYWIYYDYIDTLISQWLNNPHSADQAKSYGYIASIAHDYDRVIRILEGYDREYGDDWSTLENLIDAYNRQFVVNPDTATVRKALALCDRAEQQLGNSTAIASQKVRSLWLLNDTAAIDTTLQRLCRDNDDDAMAYFFAADIKSRLDKNDEALDLVKAAYRIDPDQQDIALGLALGYRNIGDTVQYKAIFSDWVTNANFDRDDRLQSFAEYLTENTQDIDDRSKAWVDSICDLLISEKDDARINEIRGIFNVRTMRLDDAIASFKKVNTLDPENYQARLQTVYLQKLTDDSIGALQTCIDALADIPNHPDKLLSSTHISMIQYVVGEELRSGNTARAIVVADSLIASVPVDSTMLSQRFDLLATTGGVISADDKNREALKYYAEAYDLRDYADEEAQFSFYNNYAYSLAKVDTLLDRAIDLARYASLYDAHNPNYLDTYAWVYFKRGEYADAQKQINYAIDAAIDARKNTLGYQSDVADGIISQEEADQDDNSVLLSAEDKAERRARNIEQAIKYSPELWATLFDHAGDIAFFNKDIDSAVDYWTRALDIDPDNELLARKVKNRTYFYE